LIQSDEPLGHLSERGALAARRLPPPARRADASEPP
jgi:hypothetical protein